MAINSISCTAGSPVQADRVIYRLKDSGFAPANISILYIAEVVAADGPSGTVKSRVVRGALGWLADSGMLWLPRGGSFVAAGPVLGTLSGCSRVSRALVELGIPEFEADFYERCVLDGSVLISVHTDDPRELEDGMVIFEELECQNISATRGRVPDPLFQPVLLKKSA